MENDEIEEALTVAKIMQVPLAGRKPRLIGVILAELVSTWLAGHYDDKEEDTDNICRMIFANWCRLVMGLVPINHEILLCKKKEQAKEEEGQ